MSDPAAKAMARYWQDELARRDKIEMDARKVERAQADDDAEIEEGLSSWRGLEETRRAARYMREDFEEYSRKLFSQALNSDDPVVRGLAERVSTTIQHLYLLEGHEKQ